MLYLQPRQQQLLQQLQTQQQQQTLTEFIKKMQFSLYVIVDLLQEQEKSHLSLQFLHASSSSPLTNAHLQHIQQTTTDIQRRVVDLLKECKQELSQDTGGRILVGQDKAVVDDEEQQQTATDTTSLLPKWKKNSKKKSSKEKPPKFHTVHSSKKSKEQPGGTANDAVFIRPLDLKASPGESPKNLASRRQEKLARFFGTSRTDVQLTTILSSTSSLSPSSPSSPTFPSSPPSPSPPPSPTAPRPDIYEQMANVKMKKCHSDTLFLY